MYGHSDIFKQHCSIEELQDMLGLLKNDARSLSQYGELGSSVDVFYTLSLEDRLTLLYLSLTEGDQDVQNVGRCLMETLPIDPTPRGPEDLMARMTARAKSELTKLREVKETPLRESDRVRITEQLKLACDRIGFLHVEGAFWILIPDSYGEQAIWIEAAGGKHDSPLAFDNQVTYSLSEWEMRDLLAAIQKARWALHVHNHPTSRSPGYITLCAPSGMDERTASHWKSIKPGLGGKMKFFVVQENKAVEYALPRGRTERWP